MESVTAESGPDAEGTVYIDRWYKTNAGDPAPCTWIYPWATTARSEGRIRTLQGLYRETSAAAEFTYAETALREGHWLSGIRPHWDDAWRAGDSLSLDSTAAADALGARWYVECDADDTFTVFEGPDIRAEGAKIVAYPDEDSWHKAAVEWWVAVASESAPLRVGGVPEIPVLWPGAEDEREAAQLDRAAQGVTMRTEQDRVFVTAQSPGWVWLRVPWDPWWFAPDGVPLKGGPGHLVVWADTGTTELRWDVPDNVDLLAASMTVLALLLLIPMTSINRRKGWELDPDRPRPAAAALTRLADTTDHALYTATRTLTRKPNPPPDPTPTQDVTSSDSAPDPQPGPTAPRAATSPDSAPDPDSAPNPQPGPTAPRAATGPDPSSTPASDPTPDSAPAPASDPQAGPTAPRAATGPDPTPASDPDPASTQAPPDP